MQYYFLISRGAPFLPGHFALSLVLNNKWSLSALINHHLRLDIAHFGCLRLDTDFDNFTLMFLK